MALVVVCLFLTGFTSLVLEVAWARAFTPILGSSLYATATVLAGFMAGLALGAWLISRWQGALHRPLRTFAFIQMAIGLIGAMSIPLLEWTSPLYTYIYQLGGEGSLTFLGLRFLVVSLQLGLPVILMGMLLPLASTLFQQSRMEHGSAWTSVLYGATTTGAVLGALLSGFLLLPRFGIATTCLIVGVVDIVVGIVIYWRLRHSSPSLSSDLPPIAKPRVTKRVRGIEMLIFVSGFSAMSLEISWFRMLSNVFGATVHAFSIMLGVFLLGIAIGSFAASRLVRHSRYSSLEGLYLFGMAGLLALISSAFINELPIWYAQLYWQLSAGESYFGYFFSQFLVTAAVVFPSTFCFGSVFPYLLKIHLGNSKSMSLYVSAGRLYAFNTLGGILGIVLTGLALLPQFGVSKSLLISTTIMIIASFVLAGAYLNQISHRRKFKAVATMSSLALIAAVALPRHDPLLTSQGLFMNMKGQGGIEAFIDERESPVSILLHHEEGLHGTVAVIANEANLGRINLKISGRVVAGSGFGTRRHLALLAHLPFIFNAAAESAMVIGLGTGITAGHLLAHPSLKRLDVLELEPSVVKGSRFFSYINQRPLNDPRTNLILEDGRTHLRYSTDQYDLITSDPSSPFLSGGGSLYSTEFYDEVKKRLKPKGVFSQWIQGSGLSLSTYYSALRSFLLAFPQSYLFIDGENTVLIGCQGEPSLTYSQLVSLFTNEKVAGLLAAEDLTSPEDLLGLFYGDTRHLQNLGYSHIPAHSDDNLYLETAIPLDLFTSMDRLVSLDLATILAKGRLENLLETFEGTPPEQMLEFLVSGMPTQFSQSHLQLFEELRRSRDNLGLKSSDQRLSAWYESRLSTEKRDLLFKKIDQEIMGAIKSRKTADLIDVLKEAMMYPDSKGYYASGVILGETYLQQAQFKEALSVAHKIRSEHPAYGSAYHIAAEALIQMNQLKRARAILEEGLFYHPGHQGLSKLLDTIARLPFDTQPEGEQDSFHQ